MTDNDNNSSGRWDMDAKAHTTQRSGLYATVRPALAAAGIPDPRRRLCLPPALADDLAGTARLLLPREACWLLGGTADAGRLRLRQVRLLPNDAADPRRFSVAAVDFARAEHDLRQRGLALLGFAHSHPGGAARLSAADRRELWPDHVHLVLGLPPDGAVEFAAFWLRADGIEALPLEYSPT